MGDESGGTVLERCEMLKAMYDFKATFAKTLSFRENDVFIFHHTNTKQRNWWHVINNRAEVGYVPSNYVSTIQVNPQILMEFLDSCITVLREQAARAGGILPSDRQELLIKLIEKRRIVDNLNLTCGNKNYAPLPPEFVTLNAQFSPKKISSNSFSDTSVNQCNPNLYKSNFSEQDEEVDSKLNTQVIRISHSEPSPPANQKIKGIASNPVLGKIDKSNIPRCESPINNYGKSVQSECYITPEVAYQLVDKVRTHTHLGHELSRVAIAVVVTSLQDLLPPNCITNLSTLLTHIQGPLKISKEIIEQTHDAQRLKLIFNELTSCKEDSQQRSWMLHEDEAVITDYLKELTSILKNADPNVSKNAISKNQYDGVSSLIDYYQMETRWSIRQLLLQAFGVMCTLDYVAVKVMLNSVLPMELARDMQSNSRNVPKLNNSSCLLTMLFSLGEDMPVTHMEHLGLDFITFLCDMIETPPDTDINEQIPDLFVNLILSYNLQFPDPRENIVIKSLSQRNVAKTFTEKILLLLNREEDPVQTFDHQEARSHSVVKLFSDLFSNNKTAGIFYTNDIKVLIDIIVRQLADLSPGDQKRGQYLQLCRLVMRNTSYDEHFHRRDDILKCFTRIFCEETEESREDQQLVKEISNEFSQYFKA